MTLFSNQEYLWTVIGLDCTAPETWLSDADIDAMADGNKYGQFMYKAFTKLFAFDKGLGIDMNVPDAVAVATIIWPDIVMESENCYGAVCTADNEAYGQIILYRAGAVYESMPKISEYNLNVITSVNAEQYKQRFLSLMTK